MTDGAVGDDGRHARAKDPSTAEGTAAVGVIPVGATRGNRQGRCRLCGWTGQLTKTHVPARASGNRGQSREVVTRSVDDGIPTLGLGRPKDGGLWGWWFCEACNRATGRWDQEYIRWQWPLLRAIHLSAEPIRSTLNGQFTDADPGAFVRCLWAWAFALDPTLLDLHPRLGAAVRNGHAVEPPTDRRLLLAATPSLQFWATYQRGALAVSTSLVGDGWNQRRSRLWVPEPDVTEALPVVVSAPPFLVVLVDEGQPVDFPHFDLGPWLQEPAGTRRATVVSLPMVMVLNEGLPRPLTHRDIVALPAAGMTG